MALTTLTARVDEKDNTFFSDTNIAYIEKSVQELKAGKGRAHELIKIDMEESADPFYSESNMRYLEGLKKDIDERKAHFTEHELTDVK